MEDRELFALALRARERAYAPYSRWTVGAALLTAAGAVYSGCNIENAACTPANCAERTAFFKAVSEGERNFAAIAVAGGREGEAPSGLCAPCGVCRQVMAEFCGQDFRVILGTEKELRLFTLEELLPCAFGPGTLGFGEKADGEEI